MNAVRSPSPALTIVRREVMLLARNPHLFTVMVGLTTIMLVAASLALGSSASGKGSMALFAQKTFRVQFFLLYATAMTIVPAIAAGALVHERKQDCFPLLFTTLIPPGWIVWSKLIALLCLYGGLYAGVLPFTGIIYFFAGVEPVSLLQGGLVSFSVALCTACIGLMASASAKDHIRTLYTTGWCVALQWMAPWIVRMCLELFGTQGWSWLELIAPGNAYAVVHNGIPNWGPPLAFAAYQCLIAGMCLVLASRCILPRESNGPFRALQHFAHRITSNRPFKLDPIPDGANPIAAKDVRANFLARGYRPWLLGLLGVGTAAPLYFATANSVRMGAPFLDNYLMMIIIPPLMASLVMAEREMLESLGTTLLSGEEIARGKISATQHILVPLTGGMVIGKVLGYLYLINFDQSYFARAESAGLFRLLVLLLSTTELLFSVYILPRFALFGALTRSGALAAAFSSYASVFLVWAITSFFSLILSIPFGLVGGGIAFPWVYRLIKYLLLLFSSLTARESAAITFTQHMQTWTMETDE